MSDQQQSLEDLQHIKRMMERSSRFISLSGLSGISAGISALAGALFVYPYVYGKKSFIINSEAVFRRDYTALLNTWFFWIAVGTFSLAFLSAFFFTWLRSKKQGIPIWGVSAQRLISNVAIPMIAGVFFVFKLALTGNYALVSPACLIFYGLALVNASKYTLGEVRYLGIAQMILGIVNLWMVGHGLYFWAIGFGLLHIIYGISMWFKYERN